MSITFCLLLYENTRRLLCYMLCIQRKEIGSVKVTTQKKMHTHLGVIDVSSVIGLEYGYLIKTTEGKSIYLIQPTVHDLIMKSERKTQIVYPKDLGYIASRTGLQNGSTVLEIGTGSAALTTFMASIVKPTGHIYTYDINADFMAIARKNLEKAGMLQYVTMHQQDPHLGLSIREADVAVVDLGESLECSCRCSCFVERKWSLCSNLPYHESTRKDCDCLKTMRICRC